MNRALDQATGLRRMLSRHCTRVLPLTSALGREAQAQLAIHLATAFAQLGSRALILDASRGDVAAALGLRPRYELLHLLQGEKTFDEVVLQGPDGIRVVPGARGIEAMQEADDTGWAELYGAFASLGEAPDLVLLNSAPGDTHAACRAAQGTHELVLALDSAPESVTAAYALMKTAMRDNGQRSCRLVFANLPQGYDAAPLSARMNEAARRFLGVEVRCGGVLPRDRLLLPGAPLRRSIVASDPAHPAAAAFLTLAGASLDWSLSEFQRPAAATARRAHSR